jgi:hypothetical protein
MTVLQATKETYSHHRRQRVKEKLNMNTEFTKEEVDEMTEGTEKLYYAIEDVLHESRNEFVLVTHFSREETIAYRVD